MKRKRIRTSNLIGFHSEANGSDKEHQWRKYVQSVNDAIEATPGNQSEYRASAYTLFKKYGRVSDLSDQEQQKYTELLRKGLLENNSVKADKNTLSVVSPALPVGHIIVSPKDRVSRKISNVVVTLSQKQALLDAVEVASDIATCFTEVSKLIKGLACLSVYNAVRKAATIELSEDDVQAIVFLCNKRAFDKETAIPLSEANFSKAAFEKLLQIRSLKLTENDSKVYLAEDVRIEPK